MTMPTIQNWFGLKVVILGAARQGIALARYLAMRGAQVIINDRRTMTELSSGGAINPQHALTDLLEPGKTAFPLTFFFGDHPFSLLDGADLLCLSGGVATSLPIVIEAQQRGIPLSNDSQIFFEAAACKTVGITGSAGKTTTTTLVGRMAEAAVQNGCYPVRAERSGGGVNRAVKVWVGGNIGTPLINFVDEMSPDDLAILELSSFQLEIMTRSPQVAAVLNITPNHFDRHLTMAAYQAAKAHILKFQSPADIAIVGREDAGAWALANEVRGRLWSFGLGEVPVDQTGTCFHNKAIYLYHPEIRDGSRHEFILPRDEILLRGEHNLLNVLAACAIAAAIGLPVFAMRQGIQGFHGVAHRLEFIRSWHGADWYNDSIATAPERSMAAIHSFDEPLVLLAGGRDKNLPWDEFARLVLRRVDHLIVFGEAADKIESAIHDAANDRTAVPLTITKCLRLMDAVKTAAELAKPGQVVLFSPGGTSFDEFRDFEERGECYTQWVTELR